jgi:hypothetical protein
VPGDAVHVFHQLDGLFENVVVDALDDEPDLLACLIEQGVIGVVDVPGSVGASRYKVGTHVKARGDRADVMGEGRGGHLRIRKVFPGIRPAR